MLKAEVTKKIKKEKKVNDIDMTSYVVLFDIRTDLQVKSAWNPSFQLQVNEETYNTFKEGDVYDILKTPKRS